MSFSDFLEMPSRMVCGGCGAVSDPADPYPFRCPNAGDGGDHVLRRQLDYDSLEFPLGNAQETHPFLRYRSLLHSHHLALAGGLSDSDYVAIVRELDDAVARIDGRRFVVTPLTAEGRLASAIGMSGPVWVKDETGNVAGSHKGRHLFGVLVHLVVAEHLGLVDPDDRPPLAIASCGNAALAAAVVAAAGGRELVVFVPTDADPPVVARLKELGARVTVCPRRTGEAGDPTYLRLQAAIAAGAVPFTCQGNENGLAVEGGETLGYELVSGLLAGGSALGAVVVQVGGGALASAVAESLFEAVRFGVLSEAPRVHTVQTEAAWPLRRAYLRVAERLGEDMSPGAVEGVLAEAAADRAKFMWPWEEAPHSIAHGILDDETYDWLAVTEAMLETGGEPAVVSEAELAEANRLATETTGIGVDPTGSSGLAGLLHLARQGVVSPDEPVAVLFTGARR
jgi:threonine synthase